MGFTDMVAADCSSSFTVIRIYIFICKKEEILTV
jgi:hypothetical protein